MVPSTLASSAPPSFEVSFDPDEPQPSADAIATATTAHAPPDRSQERPLVICARIRPPGSFARSFGIRPSNERPPTLLLCRGSGHRSTGYIQRSDRESVGAHRPSPQIEVATCRGERGRSRDGSCPSEPRRAPRDGMSTGRGRSPRAPARRDARGGRDAAIELPYGLRVFDGRSLRNARSRRRRGTSPGPCLRLA